MVTVFIKEMRTSVCKILEESWGWTKASEDGDREWSDAVTSQ